MSTRKFIFLAFILSLALPSTASAFDSGSTGADGDFNPTANRILNCYSTVNHDGVFNFGSVNIPSGVTVTFKKTPNNDPVTILATGDVTVNGTIDVSGTSANANVSIGRGGPSGWDGGRGGQMGYAGSKGDGPGGGGGGNYNVNNNPGAGGGYGAPGGNAPNGVNGGSAYGNSYLVPLIGGSGGGGAGNLYSQPPGADGGGGGGAILISSSGTITVNGTINANGGAGGNATGYYGSVGYNAGGGGGSGGGIRLVAITIASDGPINANGGSGGINTDWNTNLGSGGGAGIIRLEADNFLRSNSTSPPYTRGPSTTYTAATLPTLAITQVGTVTVPQVPQGAYNHIDVTLPFGTQNPVPVVISAANIPSGTNVTVTVIPQTGTTSTATAALSGSTASSTATANVNLVTNTPTPYILMVSASNIPVAALFGDRPIYAEGERVKTIKVTSTAGEGSKVFYVTESGKEVPVRIN